MLEAGTLQPYYETMMYVSIFLYSAYAKQVVESIAQQLARFKHAHGLDSTLANSLQAFREKRFNTKDIEILFRSFVTSWLVMAVHSAAVTIVGFCLPFTWIPAFVFIGTNTLVQVAAFDLTLLPIVTELVLPTIFIMPALYLINWSLYHVPLLVYQRFV